MRKDIKQERSLPVQSRVDLVDLANLDMYWVRKHEVHMRSMSQLINWSIELLCNSLLAAGEMEEHFVTLVEAKKYLNVKGLSQAGMDKKGRQKYAIAIKAETLRGNSVLPGTGISKIDHNILHNKKSVQPLDGQVKNVQIMSSMGKSGTDWDKVDERVREEYEKDLKELVEDTLKRAKASGAIKEEFSEDYLEKARKRDEEIVERENAPLKESDFKLIEGDGE